ELNGRREVPAILQEIGLHQTQLKARLDLSRRLG
ncbi:MAG: hypothetical protein QG637_784, partial [Chloroflexota bacterium]|nr:hypothetical protein [Chloroflexota bacterium]